MNTKILIALIVGIVIGFFAGQQITENTMDRYEIVLRQTARGGTFKIDKKTGATWIAKPGEGWVKLEN